jgi:large subunit ribosomal protein L29
MAKKIKKETKAEGVKKLRDLSVADLKKAVLEFTKDEFKLRMQKTSGQALKPHLFEQTRRQIARAKTLLTEKNSLVAKGK